MRPVSPPGRPYLMAAAVVLGALIISAALFLTRRSEDPPPDPVRRYSINLSPDSPLQKLDGGVALSPDGLLLVYVASTGPETKQLFLRRLGQLDTRPV